MSFGVPVRDSFPLKKTPQPKKPRLSPATSPREPRTAGGPQIIAVRWGALALPVLGTFRFAIHGALRQHIPLGLGSASRVVVVLSCRLSARVRGPWPEGPPGQQSPPPLPLPAG